MVKITFPDGVVHEYEQGVTGLQIAESISPALARDVVSCGVNGETVELNRPILEDADFVLYKFEDEEGKHTFWHTSAHLLAEALQELYPGIQFGFGPAVENGFFYDVMPPKGVTISENDFPAIEAKMKELAKKDEPVVRKDVTKADALAEFNADGQTYKCEHIDKNGDIGFLENDDLKLSYRHSAYYDNGAVITGLYLKLKKGEKSEIKEKMDDLIGRRRAKQPLEYPSAGSTFKRPEGYFAGALIEQCNLKGKSVGGAQVSEKHAGFVINKGGATCKDVLDLCKYCSDKVMEETGVKLEMEIRVTK